MGADGAAHGHHDVDGRLDFSPMTAPNLLSLPPAAARELVDRWAADRGLPGYRTGQIVRRLWQAPAGSWVDATELPLGLRADLAQAFPLPRLAAEVEQQSADGTRKYLWRLADGEAIESVLIPSGGRRTLCISSQAGCALGCTFCATGRMGFRRNLSAFEIAGQVREIVLRDPADLPDQHRLHGDGRAAAQLAGGRTRPLPSSMRPTGSGSERGTSRSPPSASCPGSRRSPGGRSSSAWPSPSTRPAPPSGWAIMPIEKKYDLAPGVEGGGRRSGSGSPSST